MAPFAQPMRKPCSTDGMYSVGTDAAEDLVHEVDVVRIGLFAFFLQLGRDLLELFLGQRLVLHVDDGELAAAAGLLDVARLDLDRLGQRLPIGDHRLADASP